MRSFSKSSTFCRYGLGAGLALAALAALASLLVVVAGPASARSDATKPLSGKKVYVLSCPDSNTFCVNYNGYLKKTLGRLGASVTVLVDNFNPAQQALHFNQAIAARPDVITVLVDDVNAIIPSLRKAQRAHIPVINSIGRLTPAGYKAVTYSVECDCAALGRQAAQNIVAGLAAEGRQTGNVVAITGTRTQFISQDRVSAFRKEMARFPQYKVVAIEDGNWEDAKSADIYRTLAAKYASTGGIQAAWGMADNQTNAIIQTALQSGQPVGIAKDGLIAVGTSCQPLTSKNLKNGTQYAGSTNSPLTEVKPLAVVVAKFLQGKRLPKITRAKEAVVTSQNIDSFAGECSFK